MSVEIDGTLGITTPALDSEGNLEYSGTLTGGTGVVNIGSGQVYKDASGNVGLGTSTPASRLDARTSGITVANFQSTNANGGYMTYVGGSTTYIGSTLAMLGSGTASDFGIVGSGANNFVLGTSSAEAARFDSNRNFLVGTTSVGGEGGISICPNLTNGTGRIIFDRASTAASARAIEFENADVAVGTITYTNTATTYNTSSDYRLKEDTKPVLNPIDRLMQLKPINFAWKVDGSRTDGFLAHEAQEVVPEAVTGEKDAVDAEGKPEYQGIDQSKLVPLLTAAIQELLAEVNTLKARIEQLENQ